MIAFHNCERTLPVMTPQDDAPGPRVGQGVQLDRFYSGNIFEPIIRTVPDFVVLSRKRKGRLDRFPLARSRPTTKCRRESLP
jgi:hypothetical protein